MRQVWILLTFLITLSGCQSAPPLRQSDAAAWDLYRQCLVAEEPVALLHLIAPLGEHHDASIEPPNWMKLWSPHVQRQPRRASVDPHAVRMACTMRAASMLAERNRLSEAKGLYLSLLSRQPDAELTYYSIQAKEALAALSRTDPTLVAVRDASVPAP